MANQMNQEKDLRLVQQNWAALKGIEEQTKEICWAALHRSAQAIKYVQHPTEEMKRY